MADGDPITPPADAPVVDDAAKRAAFERDAARAESAKLKKQLDELKGQLPTDEEREANRLAREAQAQAEEERKKKAGEFDAWRVQIGKDHEKALSAKEAAIAEAQKTAAQVEQELKNTLVGLAFAGATEWFGPGEGSKTVLLPQVAQSYFGRHVDVELDDAGNRQVVVKDANGARLVDAKTGKPLPFAKAIGELIESHPDKDHMLRGSGKVGAGSAGGAGSNKPLDLREIAQRAARGDKAAIEALKNQRPAGGVVMGTAYSR
jgi:hypothetical protein